MTRTVLAGVVVSVVVGGSFATETITGQAQT
jgi:hypothetical protein